MKVIADWIWMKNIPLKWPAKQPPNEVFGDSGSEESIFAGRSGNRLRCSCVASHASGMKEWRPAPLRDDHTMVMDEKQRVALELSDAVIKGMCMGSTFKDYVWQSLTTHSSQPRRDRFHEVSILTMCCESRKKLLLGAEIEIIIRIEVLCSCKKLGFWEDWAWPVKILALERCRFCWFSFPSALNSWVVLVWVRVHSMDGIFVLGFSGCGFIYYWR